MHLVKRIELISDEVEMHKVLNCLDKLGVSNYTVFPNVLTKSARGGVSNDLGMSGLSHSYVVAYCAEDQVKAVVQEIRTILNKFGGTCHISDAMEIRSLHCVASL